MAAASSRQLVLGFTGDVVLSQTISAAANAASPATEQILTLSSGDNVISVPAGGTTPVAVSVTKPAGNTVLVKLKSVVGDTGVPLHKTDPDSISLDSSATQIVLNAASQLAGIRLYWT